jgi:hypothetical protein
VPLFALAGGDGLRFSDSEADDLAGLLGSERAGIHGAEASYDAYLQRAPHARYLIVSTHAQLRKDEALDEARSWAQKNKVPESISVGGTINDYGWRDRQNIYQLFSMSTDGPIVGDSMT